MLLRAGPFDLCMARLSAEDGTEIIGRCLFGNPFRAEQLLVEIDDALGMLWRIVVTKRDLCDFCTAALGRLRGVGPCRNGRRFYARRVFGNSGSTEDAQNSIHVFLQCAALRGGKCNHTIKFLDVI